MILFLGPLLAVLAKIGAGAAKVGGVAAKGAGAAKGGLTALGSGGGSALSSFGNAGGAIGSRLKDVVGGNIPGATGDIPGLSSIMNALKGGGGGDASVMTKLGEQLGQRAAMTNMPAFGSSLQGSLPSMPSVAGGVTGESPGAAALMQSTFGGGAGGSGPSVMSSLRGENVGLMQRLLGDKDSMRRQALQAGLDAYSQQGGGGGGGGGVSAGGGLLPPGPTVSVPPSTYQPVATGAEGFGGAGAGLAPLLPHATMQGQDDQGDMQRRIMALAIAQRMLGGGAAGGGFSGLGGIL